VLVIITVCLCEFDHKLSLTCAPTACGKLVYCNKNSFSEAASASCTNHCNACLHEKIRIVSVAMEYAVSDLAGMLMQDPNTGVAMFETPQIIEYLEKTYAV